MSKKSKQKLANRDAEYRRALGISADDKLPGYERAEVAPRARRKPGNAARGFSRKSYAQILKERRASPARERYDAYIKSEAWAAKRLEYFTARGRMCKAGDCDVAATEVHHHTYERFGYELLADLVGLCTWHHAAVHDLHRRTSGGSLTRATERVTGLRLS